MAYEVNIGLEVHAELLTNTKMFCSCTTKYGGSPNTQCCPICTGIPGTLPVLNKRAVELAVKAGLALNCDIASESRLDRKNYFYPDLPKAYQISQFDFPICSKGYIDIEHNYTKKRIGITRIQIEEDAGKLIHSDDGNFSFVDYNRCGVPLIEIVTEPDINSPEEARIFLESISSILRYTGVSDCKMQEGSLRADVNVSVRPKGSDILGVRTEMKNLNSFRAVLRAIEYEKERQISLLEKGEEIIQETRRWDDILNESHTMRDKENKDDYRYFQEPDLLSLRIENDWILHLRKSLPELPLARKRRFINDYNLPEYDAEFITSSKAMADYFEIALKECTNAKMLSNWMMGELSHILSEKKIQIEDIPFEPYYLSKIVNMQEAGIINNTIAKQVFEIMVSTLEDPETIIEKYNLRPIDDHDRLEKIVKCVLVENMKSVDDYKAGKKKY